MGARRRRLRGVSAVAALAIAGVAAGCGSRGPTPDLVNGKTLFAGKATCGSCHTLSRAGSHGTQGPNLDAAFADDRRDGLGEGTIMGVVRHQMADPRRGSIMPANLVTGDDARDVAAYVAAVAGMPGQDVGALAAAGTPQTSSKPAMEQNGTLTIPANPTGALAFTYKAAIAKPGSVSFDMPNKAPVQHNIAIKGPATGNGPIVGQGGTSKFTASLKPGTYEFYCQVPGHEQAGMKGTLTVK